MRGLSLVVASGGHSSSRCTASHSRGLSRYGAQAQDVQAQQLWLTGPAALRHVGSSQTRARTRVPCISRQILNHCTTREAQETLKVDYKQLVCCQKKILIQYSSNSTFSDVYGQ